MKRPETELNAEDKFNNKLDLLNFKSYSIGDKLIFFYLHNGQTMQLNYESQEKAKEIYDKILSLEDDHKKYMEYWRLAYDDDDC